MVKSTNNTAAVKEVQRHLTLDAPVEKQPLIYR